MRFRRIPHPQLLAVPKVGDERSELWVQRVQIPPCLLAAGKGELNQSVSYKLYEALFHCYTRTDVCSVWLSYYT